MSNWDHLVGIPYADNANGPDSYDCAGLVRHVIESACGITLPKQPIGWRRYFKIVPWPVGVQPYDLLCFSHGMFGAVTHVGVVVSPVDFLHANKKARQVVLDHISHYKTKIKAVGKLK